MPLVKQISTGSQNGNCYIYDSLMLDVGVSYSKIKNDLKGIKLIFISHLHTDHFNKDTIRKIRLHYPNIMFVGGSNMKDMYEELELRHTIMDLGKLYDFGVMKLSTVALYHDIENFGLRIFHNDLKGIYITDTYTVEGISFKGYDFIIIEFNHDEKTHLKLAETSSYGVRFTNAMNSHLSFQQANEAINENAKDGTEILLIHLSSSYDEFMYELHYIYKE